MRRRVRILPAPLGPLLPERAMLHCQRDAAVGMADRSCATDLRLRTGTGGTWACRTSGSKPADGIGSLHRQCRPNVRPVLR